MRDQVLPHGVHPRRIELIAELLKTGLFTGATQCIVTTHSPILPDQLPDDSLFVVQRFNRETQVSSFKTWGPLGPKPVRRTECGCADHYEPLPIADRILRGDFNAFAH